MKPDLGQEISIEIRDLTKTGQGVGSYDGFTVFVDGALPKETIIAEVAQVKKNYAVAKLIKIEKQSTQRVLPPCPLFGTCGGCQLQHLKYEEQLNMKKKRVVDALERIGHFKEILIDDCQPSPQELAYRNKIQLPIKESKIGLYQICSHEVIDVDHCYIHCELGEEIYRKVKKIIKASNLSAYDESTGRGFLRHLLIKSAPSSGKTLIIFVTNGEGALPFAQKILDSCPEVIGIVQNIHTERKNTILGPKWKTLLGQSHLEEMINGIHFQISPASFFQVNPQQAAKLYTTTIDWAELNTSQTALDAYCGVGALTLQIAKQVKSVIGIDCVQDAITNAEQNAKLNAINNATFHCGKVEEILDSFCNIDTIFLNPPRKGCDPTVIEALKRHQPKSLIYISCDPATLARDLHLLSRSFQIEKVRPFDMFPQTTHVETLVQLRAIS